MTNAGIDRRKFPRTSHTYTISFKEHNEPEINWDISNTRNLSLGGALFLSSEPLLTGSLLDIRLKIPAQNAHCKCRAIVQRCKGPFKGAFYKIAIYFAEIDTNSIEQLRKSVGFFLEKNKKA